jgi:hypothetical protein
MNSYVLNISFLAKKQSDQIQTKATQVLFRKAGFNRNTHTTVKFDPPRLSGIGVRGLYSEQSLLQQCMIRKHLRIPGQPQKLYLICLAWAQLASCVGFPLLESSNNCRIRYQIVGFCTKKHRILN